jgi:5-methylcytosine-specific restriction endonuclease McrA
METLSFPSSIEKPPNLEDFFEQARERRSQLLREIQIMQPPNPSIIDSCREIILLLKNIPPSETKSTDRSKRISKSAKSRLIKKYSGCIACGGGVENGSRHQAILEVHHIIPRKYGGEDAVEDNGLLLCKNCHVKVHS